LKELLAKHQEESARRSTEMEIEQLTEELRSRKEKSEEAKVVTVENKGPSSPKKLKKLHRIFFLSDSQEENVIDQLPTKESNPGHFMLPYTMGNFNFYAMADLGANPDKDPFGRCLDEYNWVFPKEIEQLADEYKIKIRVKGQVLEEIWTKCKKARSKDKDWWYDYWYENEEKTKLGNADYNPPIVHTETFEVTKYKFNNGYSFIFVSGKSNKTLSLGRKNGSRFKKMIMEEMEETLRDDGEDSVDKVIIQKLRGNSRDRLDSYSFGDFAKIAAVTA
ncbi:hypothetical protein Tco_0872256, partial [Tanacetum coccineum]